MPLAVLLRVEEDDHGRHEVDHLTRGQQVQVGPGVPAAVSVHPLQARARLRGGGHLAQGVGLPLRVARADRVVVVSFGVAVRQAVAALE